MPALTNAIFNSGILSHYERNIPEAERLASEVIALSTQYNFAFWLAIGSILRGWARSASGATAEGVACIDNGIEDYRAAGQVLGMPYFLGLKAEALYLAERTSEALEAIKEAQAFAQRSSAHCWSAELHRLRGVFLTALDAEEAEIDASFCAAIRVAREQKSVSLQKRAEATYTEYRTQKASWSGDMDSGCLFGDCSQCAVSRFGCGKSSVIKQTLEMQSEEHFGYKRSAKRSVLSQGCWVNS